MSEVVIQREEGNRQERFYSLDSLKFIFAFAIVLFHYNSSILGNITDEYSTRPLLQAIMKHGSYATEFFFMVSGFLIAHNYKSNIQHIQFKEYFKRRISAIIAPTWLCEISIGLFLPIVMWIVKGKIDLSNIPTFYKWFQSITFTSKGYVVSNSQWPISTVTWYVDVLIICYVIYWCIGHQKRKLYVPLCLIMIFLGYICLNFFDYPFLWNVNGRGYTAFFVGVLLYELQLLSHRINLQRIATVTFIVSGLLLVISSFGGGMTKY